ncbi:hypothetical protein [Streptomyces sp. NPDC005485]|uniref:hypothetical protein n=1 Tax=Streptomyces sp. NPDC005485 TaxID=3155591 RepID=UPI0033B9DB38
MSGDTDGVLIMEAVLETHPVTDFTLWPVAEKHTGGLPPLSGDLPPLQVGTAMAVLACYNTRPRERGAGRPENGVELLQQLTSAESVIAPGGLRLRDTSTGVTVSPGCCCGLEDWRDWLDLLDGSGPWLGHDPSPGLEFSDSLVRLWPDAQRVAPGPPIELPSADLPALLASVRADLTAFLDLVEQWTTPWVPAPLTARLLAKLDACLAVTAPLGDRDSTAG